MTTKRLYETVATELQDARVITELDPKALENVEQAIEVAFASVIRGLSVAFKRDNPAFDAERFAAACKIGANVKARRVSHA